MPTRRAVLMPAPHTFWVLFATLLSLLTLNYAPGRKCWMKAAVGR